jgi:hypothetical protein
MCLIPRQCGLGQTYLDFKSWVGLFSYSHVWFEGWNHFNFLFDGRTRWAEMDGIFNHISYYLRGTLVIRHFPNFFDLPLLSRAPTLVHAGGSRRLAQPLCLPSTEKPLCPRVKHGDGTTSICVKLTSLFLRCRPNLHQASIFSTGFNLFHATSYLNISNTIYTSPIQLDP